MKSDVIVVRSSGEGIEKALGETEAVSSYKRLGKKESLHLRLLGEEMMGLIRSLTGEKEALFWIEDKDGQFELHLRTMTIMNSDKRKKLLEASTSGKNSAASGILGKLKDVFERMLDSDGMGVLPEYYADGLMVDSSTDPMAISMQHSMTSWSLRKYMDSAHYGEDDAAGKSSDGLEQSIVTALADEVKIFIDGSAVEMIIYKKIEN